MRCEICKKIPAINQVSKFSLGIISQELEGKEAAQQLGSLSRDEAIDKGIGKRAGVSGGDRYPFKEELANS